MQLDLNMPLCRVRGAIQDFQHVQLSQQDVDGCY